jgi:hypothetical protein
MRSTLKLSRRKKIILEKEHELKLLVSNQRQLMNNIAFCDRQIRAIEGKVTIVSTNIL